MTKNDLPPGYVEMSQLKKYANDLAEVYKLEKTRRKELEIVNQELQEAYLDTIYRLSLAAEYKDEQTGGHIMRMGRSSGLIAEKYGLPAEEVQNIRYAAPMHDVGKIGIPDNILMKPGRLSTAEFEIMKTHTTIGATLLTNSKAEILKVAEQIALYHHEKWNGTGYPFGLAGDEIPLVGRIVGLLDVFDALTSIRPYKDPYPVEVALDIIKQGKGEHFDPDLVDILLGNLDKILHIKAEVGNMDTLNGIMIKDLRWSERDLIELRGQIQTYLNMANEEMTDE